MQVHDRSPGNELALVLHDTGVRTGFCAGVGLAIGFIAWVFVANRVPALERVALERNVIAAAVLGDNLGYAIGHYGGRPLLDRYQRVFRISPATLKRGEDMFARYGAAAVFFARFVFGLRVFAGPLAGVLRMRWRAFALFNFLGAALWVTCIASAGYLFGQHWRTLARAMQRFNIAVLIVAVAVILFLWWRYRRQSLSKND